MTVQINAEDRQRLDRLVALGQFASVEEALHACIEAAEPFLQTTHDAGWLEYLESSIEAGLRSADGEPLIPAERVLDDLRKRRQRAA